MEITIEQARERDSDEVLQLLRLNQLPVDGLLEHLETTIVARRNGQVVGSAALEVYPDGALLRSVAVAPELQYAGVGRRLTDAAIQLAREVGAPAMYLLTTTAERYFPKFGFEPIVRQQVPPTVLVSVEFRSACPSSATVMRKVLD
jgi:N-acetylglutamate synthase-like GNAT family acetyltransferase